MASSPVEPPVEEPLAAEPAAAEPPLLDAVHLLAASLAGGAGGGEQAERAALEAVARLRAAPPLLHWSRGLMIGLRSGSKAVVDATVKAVLERLEACPEARTRDRLMAAILDACFLNLSGRPRLAPSEEPGRRQAQRAEARRADAFERAAGHLIQAITERLEAQPAALEEHRSRLLAQARRLEHLPGRGYLARAVVDFQHALASRDTSSGRVAADLLRHRQIDLFTSPTTSEATLLAYLDLDRRLPLEKIGAEHFQIYRMLLACQSKERARRALLGAMDNLIGWLDQLPQDGRSREPLMGDVVRRARDGVPWEDLDLRVCRHLEAHFELLPGDHHEEDLL